MAQDVIHKLNKKTYRAYCGAKIDYCPENRNVTFCYLWFKCTCPECIKEKERVYKTRCRYTPSRPVKVEEIDMKKLRNYWENH